MNHASQVSQPGRTAIAFEAVTVRRANQAIVADLDWQVEAGQRWAILGANGAGKTTLLKLVYGEIFPTAGTVEILGQRLGRVDLRQLRKRIGLTGAFLEDSLRPEITATQAVMSAKHAARETWWHSYSQADRARAQELLGLVGCSQLTAAKLADCSSGERQRILLARALMPQPELLILDEPMANLDLGGREQLLEALAGAEPGAAAPPRRVAQSIYSSNPDLTSLLVTHHTEEIPSSTTHLLLLKAGKIIASGRLAEVLTEDNLSQCFGLQLRLQLNRGRWHCFGAGAGCP